MIRFISIKNSILISFRQFKSDNSSRDFTDFTLHNLLNVNGPNIIDYPFNFDLTHINA